MQKISQCVDQPRPGDLTSPRMERRQFLQATAGLLGATILAGCGSSSGTTGNQTQLTQWYHQYGETGTEQAVNRYAASYSKVHPNVSVKVVWVPGDYTQTKLPAALLSPNGPDVFELPNPTLEMVKAGQIVPLDDLYTPTVKSDFIPINLKLLTINGHIYGVQETVGTGLIYYRKSMLNAAGVQPPTTIDELIAAAKKLTSNNVKGLFIGNDGGISAMLNVLPWSAGSDFIENDQIIFDNEHTVQAYQKLQELNQSGSLLLGAPTDWLDPSAFIQGLTAMQWTGLWAMPAIIKALGDDFDVLPWPALDASSQPATFWSGWAEMVNGHSKHVDEAKAFVKWLWINNTSDQQDWNLSYGFHLPPRKSVVSVATKLQSGPAHKAVQFADTYGHIISPIWDGTMTTALTDAVSNIVKNKANATTEIHNAARTCQSELTKLLS